MCPSSEPLSTKWTSDQNEKVVLFLLPDDQRTYVIGFNPDFFDEADIRRLIDKAMAEGRIKC